jgi:hypothetical protein
MEWITTSLADVMSAYWWIIVGTVIGTAAVLSGLVAPIAERLQDVHDILVLEATHRYR